MLSNAHSPANRRRSFNAQAFLDSGGVARRIIGYRAGEVIFSQGDASSAVMYIQQGSVKISVLSTTGREAVVAILGPGQFFGESSLAGQATRAATATSVTASTILIIQKKQMTRVLHEQPTLSDRFIAHMLMRNIRVEEDLVNQLLNSGERRLACTLLLLARYGQQGKPRRVVPRFSQQTLAEMIGTTPSRVNVFMEKFRKLGFIEYNGGLQINRSLLEVVLDD